MDIVNIVVAVSVALQFLAFAKSCKVSVAHVELVWEHPQGAMVALQNNYIMSAPLFTPQDIYANDYEDYILETLKISSRAVAMAQ